MMTRNLISAAAIVLVIGIGIAQGMLTDRWGVPANVTAAAERLKSIPMSFGDWQGKEGEPLAERTQATAGAIGYISRSYMNSSSGEIVSVMILCGRPGPISSHSPDVCFKGTGLTLVGTAQPRNVPGDSGISRSFFTAEFQPPMTRPGPNMTTYWACSPDGSSWTGVNDGRLEFAGRPYLYRAMISTTSPLNVPEGETPLTDRFLTEFLPLVATTLNTTAK